MTIKLVFYKGHNSKNPGACVATESPNEKPTEFTENFCENYILSKLLDSNFAATDILVAARNSYKTATARFVIAEAALCFILHFNPLSKVDPNELVLLMGSWSPIERRRLAFSFVQDVQKQIQIKEIDDWCGSILNDISDRVFVLRPFDITAISEEDTDTLFQKLDATVEYIKNKIITPIDGGELIISN